MGTGIVEILKLFFNQDALPSPLPSKVSLGALELSALKDNLLKYIDSKLSEYATSEIPSQVTEYIDSQIASAVPKYINSKLPEYLSDKLPSDIPENITPRLDTLNRELTALSEEVAKLISAQALLSNQIERGKSTSPPPAEQETGAENVAVTVEDNHPDDHELSGGENQINDQLLASGLTQAELAARLKINASSISRRKNKPDFPKWSKSKDRDSKVWELRGDRFFPVG